MEALELAARGNGLSHVNDLSASALRCMGHLIFLRWMQYMICQQ